MSDLIEELEAENKKLRSECEIAYGYLWMMPDIDTLRPNDARAVMARNHLANVLSRTEQSNGILRSHQALKEKDDD